MSVTLHSIAIFVHDIDRALKFYNHQLGLPVGKQGSFGFELLEDAPHVGVHPAQHPDAKAMVGRHTGLTFEVDDLLALSSKLLAEGVTFLAEPAQQGFGMMAMVKDPDGNVMALWEDNVSQVVAEGPPQ